MDLTGKQVLVAGLGKSGIAAGALLKKMGCMVCLFDGNEKFDRSAWEKTYPVFSDCPLWIGELPDAAVQEMELAVVSPGIPLDTPVILKLQAAGVPVVGEAELAYRFEKGRVAAITGTNGKTTTTTLVGEILKKMLSGSLCGWKYWYSLYFNCGENYRADRHSDRDQQFPVRNDGNISSVCFCNFKYYAGSS